MKTLKLLALLLAFCMSSTQSSAQQNILTYVANGDSLTSLFDIFQLDQPGHQYDSTFLVAGGTQDFSWLNNYTVRNPNRVILPTTAIDGSTLKSGFNMTGFILHVNKTFDTILNVVQFPQGTACSIAKIRTTVRTGDPTGELYISGHRYVSDSGYSVTPFQTGRRTWPKWEYFIARLDNNFINGLPTAARFFVNARCRYDYRSENVQTQMQPWDVNNKGEVVYGEGAHYVPVYNSFSYLKKVDAFGRPMVVPGWMMHVDKTGNTTYGAGKATDSTAYSMINGYMGYRGSLRSHTLADWNFVGEDANGNTRPSRYPDDFFYRTWVDPVTGNGEPKPLSQVDTINIHRDFASGFEAGPGRTGRYPDEPRSYGWASVVFDKTTNDLFVGYIMGYAYAAPPVASRTSSFAWQGQHEFDPTIVKFDTAGYLQMWDRCKKESGDDQPDHYLDFLDIDYANKMLVVLGRQHGSGTNTSWNGNDLTFNRGARGFKSLLNGTTGNVHVSWIGKYSLDSMRIKHSTFIAEYISTENISIPYTNPHYDGWQDQNASWKTTNTTRLSSSGALLATNGLKVSRSGMVAIGFTGQRIMTTADAHLKMLKPNICPYPGFPSAVRVYSPDLKEVVYSSLVDSEALLPAGFSGDASVKAVLPLRDKVLTVGTAYHSIKTMTRAAPSTMSWGDATFNHTNVVGYASKFHFVNPTTFTEPTDVISYPPIPTTIVGLAPQQQGLTPAVFPNPVNAKLFVYLPEGLTADKIYLFDAQGKLVYQQTTSTAFTTTIPTEYLANGIYTLKISTGKTINVRKIVVTH
jgi:hypothetical protein